MGPQHSLWSETCSVLCCHLPKPLLRIGVCRVVLPCFSIGGFFDFWGFFNIKSLSPDCTAFPEEMLLLSREAAEAARK